MAIGSDTMKKLKILYYGNHSNPANKSDTTEKHIKWAFEQLGHEVVALDENRATTDDILAVKDVDMFFCHKGGLHGNLPLELFIKLLNYLTCKKVFWYFDKVFFMRRESEPWIEAIAPYMEHGFLTDGTWVNRHKYENIHWLPQGIGNEDTAIGTPKEKYTCDVAFTGSPYGERREFIGFLQDLYGDKFRIFTNVFNRDLYDLCATAKVFVAPMYPTDQFYWSSRFYMTLGSGGFLVHPECYGLKQRGFISGKHYAGYKNANDLKKVIDYFIDPKNEKEKKEIQMAGYKRCIETATYLHRVKELLETVYEETPINQYK